MTEVDAGHRYLLKTFDGIEPQHLVFMKREGAKYPYNVGHHGGTNCQEVIRALLARVQYLQHQIAHINNLAVIRRLEECLWLFEDRAAERHGIDQFDFRPDDITQATTCDVCGHVVCRGHK